MQSDPEAQYRVFLEEDIPFLFNMDRNVHFHLSVLLNNETYPQSRRRAYWADMHQGGEYVVIA